MKKKKNVKLEMEIGEDTLMACAFILEVFK